MIQELYERSPYWLQTVGMQWFALQLRRQRYGDEFEAMLTGLLESQWLSFEAMTALQEEQLTAIVRHAFETVPYYRRVMDERRLKPDDIRKLSDLPKLPLLTKDDIVTQGPELLSTAFRRKQLIHGHTSGTTGAPLDVWWDRNMVLFNNAAYWRHRSWGGHRQDMWCAMLLGRKVVDLEKRRPPYWQPNFVQKQLWMSSFHLSDETLDLYVEEIRRRGVAVLEGYPSTCYILARHLVGKGETLPLTAVFTTSETLHPVQREMIGKAFCCGVFDFLGMAERVVWSTECEQHSGMHLNSEYGISEIVNEQGEVVPDGQPGYTVGTGLRNFGMPLLRYRTNDVTTRMAEPCACGRGLPLSSAVTTKAEDLVLTPDGRYISPSTLTHPFKPIEGLIKSQVVQTKVDELVVKLVPRGEFAPAEREKLVGALQERVGQNVRIVIEIVDDIPPERSGKFRWVVSHVTKQVEGLALGDMVESLDTGPATDRPAGD